MQVREIRALTGLRGIAALYVVAFHYLGGLSFSNPITTLFAHGYLAVDLFLILSGFVMALNYAAAFTADFSFSTYLRFLWRRIARIYPLYIVMTLVSSLFFYFGIYKLAPFEKSLTTVVVLNAGMVQSWGLSSSLDAPAWSISAEWAAYLLFPALLIPCLLRGRMTAITAAVSCVSFLAILCLIPRSWGFPVELGTTHNNDALLDHSEAWMALPLLRCLPEFALGVLAFRLSAASERHRGFGFPPAWVLLTFILILLTLPRSDLAVVLVFPLLIISLVLNIDIGNRILSSDPLEFLGRLSYSIYLVHSLMSGLLTCVHSILEDDGVPHAQSIAAAVSIAATLPCAYFTYRLVEIPGRRWLTRRLPASRRVAEVVSQ